MTNFEKNREREKIEMQVLEGLRSGEGVEMTPQMWGELRRKLRDKRASDPTHSLFSGFRAK